MTHSTSAVDSFLKRWASSGAAERANYQLFLSELCGLLEVAPPDPTRPDDADNAYVFERNVHFTENDGGTSIGRIDLYKRGSFVLEAKQGSDAATAEEEEAAVLKQDKTKKARRGTAIRGTKSWDDAMVRARGQADRYARALPVDEGWPPFLVVVDVGHSIELYSEFSRSGKTYVPFPDPKSFRISLSDLSDEKIRERLRTVWLDPQSLDPARRSAKVTRELAQRLAELAKLLEKAGHHAEDVARFLMRCLFTMFAEDIELIPRGAFQDLLGDFLNAPEHFKPAVEDLWRTMNTGGFSPILRKKLLRFNGGLFAESDALPLTQPMLELLHEASKADWTDVEPAIFGTLLERALDPVERHKLGAHYTPRAYVERLVLPTVIEPLREDWQAAYAAAVTSARQGDLAGAQETVRAFHEQLCKTRVLDPACGSGNFLYVTLEQMKRLEGEVLNALHDFGEAQRTLFEVDPHQFLGIEVNPRAAAIAELVLWIGYLQWHFRTRGHAAPAEPIIKNYHNIEHRDAVLAWDRKEPVLDEHLQPVTRWDGRTMKIHPVTGEEVPDESARVNIWKYINPRKAEWPEAEFVVGNPPFVGNKRMRLALGDAYVEALRQAFPELPETIDFVMYWWDRGADRLCHREIRHFGFITTNSITQTFNRQILRRWLTAENPISLRFAIPDHPWVDSEDGANVRIAMTVCGGGNAAGVLATVCKEIETDNDATSVELLPQTGVISEALTIGSHQHRATPLLANRDICLQGCKLVGAGFSITPDERVKLLSTDGRLVRFLPRYVTGSDIMKTPQERYVIDFFGKTEAEARDLFPDGFQILLTTVKPERDQNRREVRKKNWWLFGENSPKLRRAFAAIRRFIATSEVAKNRVFVFYDLPNILADGSLAAIALDDAFYIGVLSSRGHVSWALATGGTLEDRPRYQNGPCFLPFPFPTCTEAQKTRIRDLGEQLDAHRKRQQALHPKLTLTDMYNVLEKLRAGETLNAKEKTIHEQGLVSVLRQIHDDLDAAVVDAYGWPHNLTDDEILERLVALNAERAAEEARGLVRWLRPDFQNPSQPAEQQPTLALEEEEEAAPPAKPVKRKKGAAAEPSPAEAVKVDWPKGRAAQAKAVLAALRECEKAVTADELAQRFTRPQRDVIEELLQALAALGQARKTRAGKFAC